MFFFFRTEIILSLNKQSPLEGDDETLKDLGIVHGDLVYVLNKLIQDEAPLVAVESTIPLTGHQSLAVNAETCKRMQEMNSGATAGDSECGNTEMQEGEYSSSEVNNSQSCSLINDLSPPTVLSESSHCAIINRYLNEPMLVRESTDHQLPQTVICAYSLSQTTDSSMAVFVIINILMSELGFKLCTVNI
jgi:hypothetical protein